MPFVDPNESFGGPSLPALSITSAITLQSSRLRTVRDQHAVALVMGVDLSRCVRWRSRKWTREDHLPEAREVDRFARR